MVTNLFAKNMCHAHMHLNGAKYFVKVKRTPEMMNSLWTVIHTKKVVKLYKTVINFIPTAILIMWYQFLDWKASALKIQDLKLIFFLNTSFVTISRNTTISAIKKGLGTWLSHPMPNCQGLKRNFSVYLLAVTKQVSFFLLIVIA